MFKFPENMFKFPENMFKFPENMFKFPEKIYISKKRSNSEKKFPDKKMEKLTSSTKYCIIK